VVNLLKMIKNLIILIIAGYLAIRMVMIARKKGVKTMLIGLVIFVGVGYLVIGFTIYFLQPIMVYVPTAEIEVEPNEVGLAYEDIYFENSVGTKLNGWYIPSPGAKLTILFCHGNGGNISYYLSKAMMYHSLGANCFLFDYSGYAKSRGKPSEKGTYDDAGSAYKWLVETKQIEPNSIILHGWSLGGPIAANVASTEPVKGLILESTPTSAPDIAGKYYPIFPAKLFCRYKYDTTSYIKNVKCPVLIIHSPQDDIIPYSMGQKLFEIANEPKKFIEISGTHNTDQLESDIYKSGIQNWLKSL
jgi:fermentation-respiration switch protein FrsA (DUF1100 family)